MCLTPDINSSNSVDQLCVDTLRVWCAQLSASVVLEKPELAGNLLHGLSVMCRCSYKVFLMSQ